MPRNQSPNLIAGGTINPSVFVKVSTAADNTVLQAVAGDKVIGISQVGTKFPQGVVGSTGEAADAGDNIELFGFGDVTLLLAGSGGFTAGQFLKSDANGAGVPITGTTTPEAVGAVALETTTAGQYGRVQVLAIPNVVSNLTQFAAGNGTSVYGTEGLINVQTAAAGNGADQTEDTMHTFTLPANSLSGNGKALRIRGWGTTAANADNKTLKVYFGTAAQTVASAVAANNKAWYFELVVVRQSVGNQLLLTRGNFNAGEITPVVATATQDETTALTIKTTAQDGTANTANAISESCFMVEFLN